MGFERAVSPYGERRSRRTYLDAGITPVAAIHGVGRSVGQNNRGVAFAGDAGPVIIRSEEQHV